MNFKITLPFLITTLFSTLSLASDPHSYAEPERVQVKHIDLNLQVDVEKQTIKGVATLTLDRKDKTAPLILDSNGLKVESVQVQESKTKWTDTPYTFGNIDPVLGSKFEIQLPSKASIQTVRIKYSVYKDAPGLQWNSAEQTLSRRPFLTSNNQPIFARSWFPSQDTPVVRVTYSATIEVAQPDLMAVMSTNNATEVNAKGKYTFNMEIPVPSYLIALGVGKLGFKSTGPRTGVYAEPEILEQAATEFSETEKMILAAEKLYGKYVWGRYDLLVLPASYPWGGMENPRLTFVTPTIITGKKDLVDVVAHEIAHSWSGNLVTNAQWSDLWINEGFTTYVQYRIIEELHGNDIRMRDMALDKRSLENDIKDVENLKSEDTRLKTDLKGREPDEAFTSVPYIKGALFLYAIEEKIGKSKFDQFLKQYFSKYTFKSITTNQAIEELSTLVGKDFIDEWVNKPGFPQSAEPIDSAMIKKIDGMVKTFKMMGGAPNKKDLAAMTSKDICYYLESLPKKSKIFKLNHIDAAFGFSDTVDPEVRTLWYKLALPNNYKPAFETAPEFLSKVGRGKFVVPVYEALLSTKNGTKLAKKTYEKNKSFYSPLVQSRVEKKIYKDKKSTDAQK